MASTETLTIIDEQPRLPFGELRTDLFPGDELVNQRMNDATALVAIVAKVQIEEFPDVADGVKLQGLEKNGRVEIIDNTGATILRAQLSKNEFGTDLVGAEGGKEKQADKGELNIDIVLGRHGNGHKLVWGVHDVIEGTTAAAHNRPGAISIIATTTAGGIIPTPKQHRDDGTHLDIEYMEKMKNTKKKN